LVEEMVVEMVVEMVEEMKVQVQMFQMDQDQLAQKVVDVDVSYRLPFCIIC